MSLPSSWFNQSAKNAGDKLRAKEPIQKSLDETNEKSFAWTICAQPPLHQASILIKVSNQPFQTLSVKYRYFIAYYDGVVYRYFNNKCVIEGDCEVWRYIDLPA